MVRTAHSGGCVMWRPELCAVPGYQDVHGCGSRGERIVVDSPEPVLEKSSRPRVRTLKIERDGGFFKGPIKPKIRLMGHWLEQAGFKPGNRVSVTCLVPGIIELRSDAATENGAPPTAPDEVEPLVSQHL